MGIRGFTTFVNEHRLRCFRPYQLRNTDIVIDGNNLAFRLYNQQPMIDDCFGGNYNIYANSVREFFKKLIRCNIRPMVLLNGNNDEIKIEKTLSRNEDRVKTAEKIGPALKRTQYQRMFPLFTRQLFSDLLLELDVRMFRCEYEVGAELARLAYQLNCPVLSQDSEFLIFDVAYIPFDNFLQYPLDRGPGDSCWYWKCKIFRTQYLLDCYPGLTLDHLPLIPTLVGNDHVKQVVFEKFCSVVGIDTYRNRMKAIFLWLQKNPPESALTEILCHVDSKYRDDVKSSVAHYKEMYELKLAIHSKALEYLDSSHQTSKPSDQSENTVTQEPCKKELKDVPEWFMDLHHRGIYHQYFLQMCLGSMIILIPQLENYDNCNSHTICYPIISALNEILNSSVDLPLKVTARGEGCNVTVVPLAGTMLTLPKLEELPQLSKMRRLDYLYDVLHLSQNKAVISQALDAVPLDWRLYMLSIIYWRKFATAAINDNHIYSVIICALILKEGNNIIKLYHGQGAAAEVDTNEFEIIRSGTPITEWQAWIEKTRGYFFVKEEMRSVPCLYNVRIIDAFAQLQTSVLYILYANTLFDDIFQRHIISDFYNGTFSYNFYTALKNGLNVFDKFGECPKIIEMVQTLFNVVKSSTQ